MKKLKVISILSNVALFALLLFLASCSRSLLSTREISDYSGLQSFVQNRDNFLSSKSLKIRFKTSLNIDGKENRISGKILSLPGDCLFVQLMSSTIGVEVAQLYFFNDSLLFVNKIDKTWSSSRYTTLSPVLSFTMLKSLLTDSYYYSDSIGINNDKCHYLDDFQIFVANDSYNFDNVRYFVSTHFDRFGNVGKTDVKSYDGNSFSAVYSSHTLNYTMPAEVKLDMVYKKNKFSFTLLYESVDIVNGSDASYKVPSLLNYKRIDL